MSERRVEVSIGHVVIDGIEGGRRAGFLDALVDALERRLGDPLIAWRSAHVGRVGPGRARVRATSGAAIGEAIATSVESVGSQSDGAKSE
jgi:hypothetical protein